MLEAGMPVLGICLGAQLIAKAAGAEVTAGEEKEIGWYPLTLTEEGKKDRLLAGLPDTFPVFQWHGETFAIPAAQSAWPARKGIPTRRSAWASRCTGCSSTSRLRRR